jgi:hypothetical protein
MHGKCAHTQRSAINPPYKNNATGTTHEPAARGDLTLKREDKSCMIVFRMQPLWHL